MYDFDLLKINPELHIIVLVIKIINLISHFPSLSDENHAW